MLSGGHINEGKISYLVDSSEHYHSKGVCGMNDESEVFSNYERMEPGRKRGDAKL